MDFHTGLENSKAKNYFIKTIEWDMMDKTKFFPLSMLSSFTIRCGLYPFILIQTRLQVQKHNELYTGIFNAYKKIYRYGGFRGLYRGFWISSFEIVGGVCYLSTYESVRHILHQYNLNSSIREIIAGGVASIVGDTIIVPFDVLSQHLMMIGIGAKAKEKTFNTLGLEVSPTHSKFAITLDVIRHIFQRDGLLGFYRGYWASLCSYIPNSALWWNFYHLYQDQLLVIMPTWTSHLLIQGTAGILGGFTTTILTNPLDIVRARIQVQRLGSMRSTFRDLWVEEGFRVFSKGLSPRLIQSATFSFTAIVGYETIKRMSISDEYKEFIKW